MKARFYAIFNSQGFVRAVKGGRQYHEQEPPLESGERSVRMVVTIPDAVFKPQSAPTAEIEVEEHHVRHPIPEPFVEVTPGDVDP